MASLIVEIRKIGVNINQIAAVANTQKYVNKEMQTKIIKHQEEIFDILQKILEEVYDTEEHSFKKMEHTLESLEKKIDKQTEIIKSLEKSNSWTCQNEVKSFKKKTEKSATSFFPILRVIHKILFRQNQKIFPDADYERFHKRIKKQKRYKIKNPAVAGNILYRDLVNSQGNNLWVRLSLSAVPKLYAYPFFFSARLYSDYALVTIKKRDKELFKKILESAN